MTLFTDVPSQPSCYTAGCPSRPSFPSSLAPQCLPSCWGRYDMLPRPPLGMKDALSAAGRQPLALSPWKRPQWKMATLPTATPLVQGLHPSCTKWAPTQGSAEGSSCGLGSLCSWPRLSRRPQCGRVSLPTPASFCPLGYPLLNLLQDEFYLRAAFWEPHLQHALQHSRSSVSASSQHLITTANILLGCSG